MTPRSARFLVVAAFAAGLVGCADKEAVVHEAETEGIYLDVGSLDYQVQLSRVLNQEIVPDRAYLTGLPEGAVAPASDETYFAVFMRVQNQTKEAHPMATEFEIEDTQENRYEPIEIEAAENPLAYGAEAELPPGGIYPATDSVTSDSPTQGAMLLFKLPYSTLQNRPLEFKIKAPDSPEEEAVVDLDV